VYTDVLLIISMNVTMSKQNMQRTQVYLPVDLIEKLRTQAIKTGVSMAEVIRRAINEVLK
jgi:hypothetical protein